MTLEEFQNITGLTDALLFRLLRDGALSITLTETGTIDIDPALNPPSKLLARLPLNTGQQTDVNDSILTQEVAALVRTEVSGIIDEIIARLLERKPKELA